MIKACQTVYKCLWFVCIYGQSLMDWCIKTQLLVHKGQGWGQGRARFITLIGFKPVVVSANMAMQVE